MSTKSSLKKSGTFSIEKSPPPPPPPHSSTTFVPLIRKPDFSIELFPTSLQPTFGEGQVLGHHVTHPHSLAQMTLSEGFTCAGCKDYGAGNRFTCQQCDFQLHLFCAQSPPALNAHPLHAQHQLLFYSKPKPGGMSWPKCDICGKASRGFTFRCSACSFQMHPCCALLSTEMNISSLHPHMLNLLPTAAIPPGFACAQCKRKRSGRVYGCTVCHHYHLHAVCAKDIINGLQHNGGSNPPPTMLGAATRLVIGFIGKLLVGIGEGIGEDLVQDIAKGTCTRRGTRTIE